MPFRCSKTPIVLNQEDRDLLLRLSVSRTESVRRVERAHLLLRLVDGVPPKTLAQESRTHITTVYRLLNKALELGVVAALDDLQRSGRPADITPEAQTWIVSLACQKPKDLGYSYELWTVRLLQQHVRQHAIEVGHPSVTRIGISTISELLSERDIKPHKIRYYLERRDPDFDEKMAQVLVVYQQAEWTLEQGKPDLRTIVSVSYDEKPGIQAIGTTAPDLPPQPGKHACVGRDYEYVRHGTLSVLAGIDLVTGTVIGTVEDRHRSQEFVAFLQKLDGLYPPEVKIQMILDNHSAHTSKETRAYLQSVPNRFEFVFTPKHASWLNIIESFFAKMSKSMLRGIRVTSKEELRHRIEQYLDEINENPVPFRWKYRPESAAKETVI